MRNLFSGEYLAMGMMCDKTYKTGREDK